MRLLLVGAFPYPHHQGSQVYLQEQAIALRAAGAEVELLTYPSHGPLGDDPDRWRALDGFVHHAAPAWTGPRKTASGPNLGKPLADLALTAAIVSRLRASHDAMQRDPSGSRHDASIDASARHGLRYDAVLAHHVEAVIATRAALRALAWTGRAGPPVIYCAHTLLGRELGSYLPDFAGQPETRDGTRRTGARRVVDALGERLDRLAARCGDGWIALTPCQARIMTQATDRPGRVIAPPVADPRLRPDGLDADAPAVPQALEAGRFIVYSGNLDGYQDLAILSAVARILARRAQVEGRPSPPILVASHASLAQLSGGAPPGVFPVSIANEAGMRALVSAARATLVPRRDPSGFPIKLANALALGVPPIAFQAAEWGLMDGVNARIADPERPPAEALADAIQALARDAGLAARLGEGARATWAARHRPDAVARAVLELIAEVGERRAP